MSFTRSVLLLCGRVIFDLILGALVTESASGNRYSNSSEYIG